MRLCVAVLAGMILVLGGASRAHGPEGHESSPVLFEPPIPGSYELPPIQTVREHTVLDTKGEPVALPGLEAGQVAVVSLVYRACADSDGCPLALATLKRLDRRIHETPALRGRVRLISLSFDPRHDTPAKMAELRASLQPRDDWSFLTTPDEASLRPILEDYGQDVRERTPDELHHVLKVFLIDDRRAVRNIYSAGFLDPALLLADIETLRLEKSAP